MYYININVLFREVIDQLNKHGDLRMWFTESDVKHFRSGASITNMAEKQMEYTIYSKQNKNFKLSPQVYFKDFVHRC